MVPMPVVRRVVTVVAVTALCGLAAARSIGQLAAMSIVSTTSRTGRVERASQLDPGSYRIHTRLAAAYLNRGSCTRALAHATAAHDLYPNAPAPRRLLRACAE